MRKTFTLLFLCLAAINLKAQTSPGTLKVQAENLSFKEVQPYGVVDMADLEMKTCDFEPDANAEVLFDKGDFKSEGSISMNRHTRIKILNDFGKNQGNVRLEYVSFLSYEIINNLQAETINLENGKATFTKLDPKAAYVENIDKFRSALVFALPNVKAGSIIEFKYTIALLGGYFPSWYFQSTIPTRYSEIKTDFPGGLIFRVIPHVRQPYAKNIGSGDDYTQVKALVNVHSLPKEPYIDAIQDNLQRMEYLFLSPTYNNWGKIGERIVRAPDFGQQYNRSITGENEILKKAKSFKTDNEKIAYIFDTVKNAMKWNEVSVFYTIDGTVKAWDKKSGNSTEINMILFNLLKKAGIKAFPMVVSTKTNGKVNPANPNLYAFNNMVVYIPVDTSKIYILDATSRYNLFNVIPIDELNTFGLNLDEGNRINLEEATRNYETVFLQNEEPAIQSVYVNAEIKPSGKMSGNTEINSYSYHKINALREYNTDGEEKFIKYLSNNDNNIKISALKLEGMNVDTLPLTQKFDFNADLTSSDENYIYFNTNLFTLMGENPFKNEVRYSDIDFGYRDNYAINCVYKLPAGYKTDALPKSMTIVTPDQSIVFKRIVAEDDGSVLVKYSLNHKKTIYFREDYQDIRDFYKKMYELLNEQIILKKG